MQKRYLLAPGPTQVPPEVLLAMAQPLIHHRAPECVEIFARVREGLKWIFQTRNDVLILASTGTGGMEGAVSNFLSPGEKALVVNGGKFGERWGKICRDFGVEVEEIQVEWGRAVDPDQVKRALEQDPRIRAVYIQASETSTGVAYNTRAIAEIVSNHENTLMIVDAITAVGVFDIRTDEWALDVVVAGSQKAFMLPPGLCFVSVSEKAWRRAAGIRNSRFYFNFLRERENQEKNQTAYSAAVSLIVGLEKSFQILKSDGLQQIFARHHLLASATREAMKGIGLTLFARESPSDAVTALCAPEGYDGQAIYRDLRTKYGITAAGGQDHLKGKVFRISHMGYCDVFDIIVAVAGVEMVLKGMGYPVRLGEGVGIAQEILLKK